MSTIIGLLTEELYKGYTEYLKNCERDITDCIRITSSIKALTAELSSQRECAEQYFKLHIEERERMYKIFNKALDSATRIGDAEVANLALTALAIVHKKSPFSF